VADDFIDPMAYAMGYRSFAAPRLVDAHHPSLALSSALEIKEK
jgi:hypothetical protein